MTRSLKALGLALAMAFAFAAFASAASATTHHFNGTAGDELKVVANEDQKFTPTTGGATGFICHEVTVSGSLPLATNTSVTVEPHYNNCELEENGVGVGGVVKVETNGCHYTFEGLTTTGNPTGGEHASVQVVCPEGAVIQIRVTELKLKCAGIGTQTVADSIRYEDLGNGTVKVIPTAHGIVSKTNGAACENKEGVGADQIHNNGAYTGSVTIGAAHNVSLSATP